MQQFFFSFFSVFLGRVFPTDERPASRFPRSGPVRSCAANANGAHEQGLMIDLAGMRLAELDFAEQFWNRGSAPASFDAIGVTHFTNRRAEIFQVTSSWAAC